MNQDVLLTNQPLMDFILSHIFSIVLFSQNGITLKRNFHSEAKNPNTNPVIGLYPKGLPVQTADCSWRTYKNHQTPCNMTTGYSIQLLSKTANFIFKHPHIFKNPSQVREIGIELSNVCRLQLDYCLENIKDRPYSVETYTSILEGYLSALELNNTPNNSLTDAIDAIYSQLSLNTNLNSANTLELSRIANAVYHLIHKIPYYSSAKEFISTLGLELIHRRNYLGLFQRDFFNHKTAPLSWQFHCIASLLLSYSIHPIEKFLEGAFSVFNQVYQLAWNPYMNLFSFGTKRYVRYSPFEIGATIKALSLLSTWVSNEEQSNQLCEILSCSYFPILAKEFFAHYGQTVLQIYAKFLDKMQIPYEPFPKHQTAKVCSAPVFPDIIQISRPHNYGGTPKDSERLQIRWINSSPIHIRHSLELCIYIIDYLEDYHENREQLYGQDQDFNWLNLLISMLRKND